MKILTIVGSPRENGNTHFLSQKFGEGAAKVGAEVDEVFLQKYSIAPCRHCFGCLKEGICKIDDDFGEIREKLLTADGILLASPVYCCSVTGQMKCFMDRCYSLSFPTWETGLEGKPVFLLVCAGYPPDERYKIVIHHKFTVEAMLKLQKDLKVIDENMTVRNAIDAMKPFDTTVDTLKLMYQFCAFVGLQPVAFQEVLSLGHDKKAVQERPDEIEKASQAGAKFTMMAAMIKQKAFIS